MSTTEEKKGKIIGIGGIFYKCKDPEKTKKWYDEHFNMETDSYGKMFFWDFKSEEKKSGGTQWSPFKDDTEYFNPSKQEFMINYIVENLDELMVELKNKGIEQVGDIMRESYGNFGWIIDVDGKKIELWEPKKKQ
eukprot:gene7579-11903_t